MLAVDRVTLGGRFGSDVRLAPSLLPSPAFDVTAGRGRVDRPLLSMT